MYRLADHGVRLLGGKPTANLPGGPVQPFDMITSSALEASDHGAVWADFNV